MSDSLTAYLEGRTSTPLGACPAATMTVGGKLAGRYLRRIDQPDAPAGVPKMSFVLAYGASAGVTFRLNKAEVTPKAGDEVCISGAFLKTCLTENVVGHDVCITFERTQPSGKGADSKVFSVVRLA